MRTSDRDETQSQWPFAPEETRGTATITAMLLKATTDIERDPAVEMTSGRFNQVQIPEARFVLTADLIRHCFLCHRFTVWCAATHKFLPDNRMHSVFRDPISGLTHLAGAVFAIVALGILMARAAMYGEVVHIVSFAVFGATLFLMFAASALYHLIHASEQVILWLKRIDHIAIFLLIAGTYTPFCLIPLYGNTGLILLVAVWSLALAGIALKLFWISAPRWLSTLIYVGMGWLVVFAFEPAMARVPEGALWWLLFGGIAYSVGAIVYALRWPDPWPRWVGFHEIWHIFVMAGAFCHFWAIAFHLSHVPMGAGV